MAGLEDILGQVLGGAMGGSQNNNQQQQGGGLGGALGGLGGGGGLNLGALAGPLIALLLGKLGGSGGLGDILGKLQANGLSSEVDSWVGTDGNQSITADQLSEALGTDTINELAEQSGLSPDEVSSQLSEALPQVIDQISPDGELPDVSGGGLAP